MSDQPIPERIAESYTREIGACRDLERFADDFLEGPWEGRKQDAPSDGIVLAEFARQTKTYRAAVLWRARGTGNRRAC